MYITNLVIIHVGTVGTIATDNSLISVHLCHLREKASAYSQTRDKYVGKLLRTYSSWMYVRILACTHNAKNMCRQIVAECIYPLCFIPVVMWDGMIL